MPSSLTFPNARTECSCIPNRDGVSEQLWHFAHFLLTSVFHCIMSSNQFQWVQIVHGVIGAGLPSAVHDPAASIDLVKWKLERKRCRPQYARPYFSIAHALLGSPHTDNPRQASFRKEWQLPNMAYAKKSVFTYAQQPSTNGNKRNSGYQREMDAMTAP